MCTFDPLILDSGNYSHNEIKHNFLFCSENLIQKREKSKSDNELVKSSPRSTWPRTPAPCNSGVFSHYFSFAYVSDSKKYLNLDRGRVMENAFDKIFKS